MPTKTARICLDCSRVTTNGSRCPEHQRLHDAQHEEARGSAEARGYGPAWRRISRAVLARDGYVCYLCGGDGANTVDHVIAKENGGTDDPSNLRAAHLVCNSSKGAK